MTPDLEEMIRQRAHAIWEQEGRPHGRHEEHWQKAAAEITEELDRIRAAHTLATAEQIEAPAAPRKGRPRRVEGAEPTAFDETHRNAPRKRGRTAASEAPAEAAPATANTTRRRTAKGTEGAQSEPATEPVADPAPKTRRKKGEAAQASPDASAPDRPVRRGRKPKTEPETMH